METATLTNRPCFKAGKETEAATALLMNLEIGQVATWEQLSAVMGVCATDHRSSVATARKTLLNEHQMVFASVPGVGFQRLDDSAIVENEQSTTGKVRRTIRNSLRRLSTVKPEALSPEQKMRHGITAATLGAVALCVRPSSISKVQQRLTGGGEVDSASVLKLFSS